MKEAQKHYGLTFTDVYSKTITLTSEGIIVSRTKGIWHKFQQTIPYASVIDIYNHPATMLSAGFFTLLTSSGEVNKRSLFDPEQANNVAEDENSFAYRKKQTETIRTIIGAIGELARRTPDRITFTNSLSEKAGCDFVERIDGMDGHKFEYFCADVLRKNGFADVQVTKGSGDQGVDILAIKDGIKYAIQCKNYASALSNTPVQEVNAGKTFYGCHVGVVMTNSTFTPGAKTLAQATGVLLWDRAVLQSMIGTN